MSFWDQMVAVTQALQPAVLMQPGFNTQLFAKQISEGQDVWAFTLSDYT